MELENYVTLGELARRWGVSRRRVNALVNEGRVPAAKVCGIWLCPRSVVDVRRLQYARKEKRSNGRTNTG